jgi:hypothetical protein
MSISFKPNYVPSDVVARWPRMALSLWKRSFKCQAAVLLATAMLLQFIPELSMLIAFVIAPSLFLVSFAAVQIADEKSTFAWGDLLQAILPGVFRLAQMSLKFAVLFGAALAVLAGVSQALVPDPALQEQYGGVEQLMRAPGAISEIPQNLALEFLHFCATWTYGVMTMVFLGMFIVAIWQGIFGVVLHAQQGMGTRESRLYGWQAWQMNTGSIEQAMREAPPAFWYGVAAVALAVACAFQTVYLSPVGLLLATYIPCLAFVAYRSIFLGKHENVPAMARSSVKRAGMLPAFA